MGRLKYDNTAGPIHIEDETLAHLKVIIATKLRRQESFMMTWSPIDGGPDKRMTAWIHPSVPLLFSFDDEEAPAIDPQRLEEMMHATNATGELVLDHLTRPAD
ncbi:MULTISPECIES: hypothetical protein [unclassified Microbacterium]|uniref:DUF7882 family protein n=1 Tax=unclassified Microbacterium TaxID=2609290 RepID=UPI001D562469|nr:MULTISPECIES: hypothetical protein [unclassified Microbacterium]CAH0157779.1 hypothetical protein SRABI121_01416 [Microbacterium sp. Bi121]HWK76235.1 hypothetical protein [Microbacterium sp.]